MVWFAAGCIVSNETDCSRMVAGLVLPFGLPHGGRGGSGFGVQGVGKPGVEESWQAVAQGFSGLELGVGDWGLGV